MRVVLAGATGAVGTVLTDQLLAAGHQVTGLTRTAAGADRLRAAGAGAAVVDVLDRPALLDAFRDARADAVVHQATAISGVPTAHRHLDATNRLRTEGTAHLLELAERLGATRFVTQSFGFGYGYHGHGTTPVTEEAPFGEPGRGRFDDHLTAMRENEKQVLGSRDLAGTALRYGMFYGVEANTLKLLDQAERGRLAAPRHGSTVSMVHLEDAAAAAVAALERGRGGEAYNVAGDVPTSWTAYMQAVASTVGARPPLLIPNGLLRLAPYLGTLMTRADLALDSTKAKRDLGWAPRFPTVEDGLAEIARRRSERP
ncbi:NAD(P)-dependent oxidoreductase [Isoptericola sp. BMS4]|uniref:NAD-dependent epimerase/dehydratase family protein n=1 Tax=Isoptericola sp. BMS4 TaxID=2527875 RepID=UPI00141FFADF|nr:NAD(P)-dependent oxidoreductase [Isoptericola sp. BMS4]